MNKKKRILLTRSQKKLAAFTLPEILIAVSIFAVVSTVSAILYTRSFRESKKASEQNQIYDDARFVLDQIANEVKAGTIDYDEYYNQNVVIPQVAALPNSIKGEGLQDYGQNYGRYFSSFFNPGSDQNLGYDCNDGSGRNKKTCAPLRRTLDRQTGENPFAGKYDLNENISADGESAFCGVVSYLLNQNALSLYGLCKNGAPDPVAEKSQSELYLISADGKVKTILAREKTSANAYALSILKLNGVDTNNDGITDSFVCAPEFSCRGGDGLNVTPDANPALNNSVSDATCNGGDITAIASDLPRYDINGTPHATDLSEGDSVCDPASGGFAKDFVPISPLRITIKDIKFLITPFDDPHYGFSEEKAVSQPRVTILITIEPNLDYVALGGDFAPLTLIETVSAGARNAIPAPLLVQ